MAEGKMSLLERHNLALERYYDAVSLARRLLDANNRAMCSLSLGRQLLDTDHKLANRDGEVDADRFLEDLEATWSTLFAYRKEPDDGV
jgi:hypothetical protein